LGKVLILAREELIAALLGLMVEVCGYQPKFASPQQSAEEAAEAGAGEERPAAVLIDCDHPDLSDDLIRRIRSRDSVPILFSAFRRKSEVADLAQRMGTRSFTVPVDCGSFARILEG
jgi:DNA-binding response OmpR family regulator